MGSDTAVSLDRDNSDDPDRALSILHRAVDAVVEALAENSEWGPSSRPGQYLSDLVADRAATSVLHDAGIRVLSEESGVDPGQGPIAVLDPLDGSTNAARRLPWFATSVCLLDDSGPKAAVVHDHVSGDRFCAERGRGARRIDTRHNSSQLRDRREVSLADAIIGVNDVPVGRAGWAQYRCLGAIALDLCAVAEGRLDGYVDFSAAGHGPWDYLGALLVCEESGVAVRDGMGLELVTTQPDARRMPVAARGALLGDLLELRAALR